LEDCQHGWLLNYVQRLVGIKTLGNYW